MMEREESEPDDALVRAVLAGAPHAFDRLVDRYWVRAHQYASRVLGSRTDGEDAVQEAFLHAYVALGRYAPRGRFSGWFFRILVNECRAIARRRLRLAKVETGDRLDQLDWDAAREGHDGERHDPDAQLDAALSAALGSLEPLLREAFLLRHLSELSYAEMAEVTGAGESALKMRVMRARDQLRTILPRNSL